MPNSSVDTPSRLDLSQSEPVLSPIQSYRRSTGAESSGQRRRVSATSPLSGSMHHPKKPIKGDAPTCTLTPRTQRMHPPGFHMPVLPADLNVVESGRQAMGNLGRSSDETVPQVAPKRKRKKIPPDEVKALSKRNGDIDRQALIDAEARWQMFCAPVYGDHLLIEEECVGSTIRFAQIGLRWVEMVQAVGISVSNRRYRAELRSRHGYGLRRPAHTIQLFSTNDEFGRTKARNLETPTALIEEHQSGLDFPAGIRLRRRSTDANHSV